MTRIDTRAVVSRLRTIESLAVIPRVSSTNLIARRIVSECVENELSLPSAMIVAGEQFAGRGRNARSWSSPAGKGIYATTLHVRPTSELPLVPLEMANTVATYLRDVYAIDAHIKWPNDVFVAGRKIAGVLIEARSQEEKSFLIIGIGINVEPVKDDTRPNAVAITEASPRNFNGIEAAIVAFVEHVDERLSRHPFDRQQVLEEWRSLCLHRDGDRIQCVLGDRTITGTWAGIDDMGRAMIRNGSDITPVSAGDIVLQS
jgi:BirA family biotin operon repressor/biotin-[acetyl-CoA-carboxylase] ligase